MKNNRYLVIFFIVLALVGVVLYPKNVVKKKVHEHEKNMQAWEFIPAVYQRAQVYVNKLIPTPDPVKELEKLTNKVQPKKFDLGIHYGDVIVKLVKYGVIDKGKFIKLYEKRDPLTQDQLKLLDEPSHTSIVVTKENAEVVLNLLWPLGIANKTSVLSNGPMGKEYKKDAGNFASTGGWTLGKQEGGQLFNQFSILPLTPNQEAKITEIAKNIYRPCCDNSTYFPDCNHGAAMLGFIQLAVTQGMPKDEIYRKALVLNSYWFSQTYIELAMYFAKVKNVPWSEVDPKLILGNNYSSGKGYKKVSNELSNKKLVPKTPGGDSCGV